MKRCKTSCTKVTEEILECTLRLIISFPLSLAEHMYLRPWSGLIQHLLKYCLHSGVGFCFFVKMHGLGVVLHCLVGGEIEVMLQPSTSSVTLPIWGHEFILLSVLSSNSSEDVYVIA